MKRNVGILLVLMLIITLFSACGGSGQETDIAGGDGSESGTPRVIKMGYPDPAGDYSHYSYFVKFFNEELDKLTGGMIRFEGYADSILGNETDMLNAMRDGSLESACLSVGVYSSQIPALQIFSLPYLFNYHGQYAVLTDNEDFMKRFKDILVDDWGIMLMGSAIDGGRYEILNTRDVKTIDDMKGLVVRITTSNIMQATLEAMGASPTVIPFSEVYTAFSTGVVDAVYVPIETYVFKGIYDSASSITMIDTEPCLGWPMMSVDVWESFTPEEQAWITEACAKAIERQREFLPISEQYCLDLMNKEAGIYLNEPDLQPFKDATRSVHKKFAPEIGEDIMQEAYNLLDVDNKAKGYETWAEVWSKY
jgi:TRAP-type C4-dicarboxylate transport system substrate-binding protein